jgi:transcriptional regulator with XRE-family HTH domain
MADEPVAGRDRPANLTGTADESVASEDRAAEHKVVGGRIRELRNHRGISLRELSRRSGLSPGFLSLVERGRSSLALTSLRKIADALNADVGAFFADGRVEPQDHHLPHITRADQPGDVAIAGYKRTYKLLSGRVPNRKLEPILVTIEPSDVFDEPSTHEGEDFAYVLSGELVYTVSSVDYRLKPGDSIHHLSTVPHTFRNDTQEPAVVLWVNTWRLI